jgi:hypothetical protein
MGGDFNLIRNVISDRKGGNFHQTNKYKETLKVLKEIEEAEDLIDISLFGE